MCFQCIVILSWTEDQWFYLQLKDTCELSRIGDRICGWSANTPVIQAAVTAVKDKQLQVWIMLKWEVGGKDCFELYLGPKFWVFRIVGAYCRDCGRFAHQNRILPYSIVWVSYNCYRYHFPEGRNNHDNFSKYIQNPRALTRNLTCWFPYSSMWKNSILHLFSSLPASHINHIIIIFKVF